MVTDEHDDYGGAHSTLVPTSMSSWIITCIGMSLLLLIAIAMIFGTYSRDATSRGWLKPDKGLIRIVAPQLGNVEKIHVTLGEAISKGQVIATINLDTNIAANRRSVDSSLSEIDNQISENRLSMELQAEQSEERQMLLRSELISLREELELMFAQLDFLKERSDASNQVTERIERLNQEDAASLLELVQQRERSLTLKQSIKRLEQDIVVQQERILSKENEVQSIPSSLELSLSEIRRTISGLQERKFNLAQQGVITLTSPIDGMIAAIPVSEGMAITQGDLVATILPNGGKFEAELFVASRDASLVQVGQEVRIKYHGFPYQRYGVMTGTVASFSRTIFLPNEIPNVFQLSEPAYRVIVELDRQEILVNDENFPLKSGMTLDADIIYGRERLWRLVF